MTLKHFLLETLHCKKKAEKWRVAKLVCMLLDVWVNGSLSQSTRVRVLNYCLC
jgi:type IV secretory pathway TrbF-like protein